MPKDDSAIKYNFNGELTGYVKDKKPVYIHLCVNK